MEINDTNNVRIEISKQTNSRGEKIKHLVINNEIWMSNDDIEYRDIERSIKSARGHCLVGGLGMGIIVKELWEKDNIDTITVVEINPNIIFLMAEEFDLLGFTKNVWTNFEKKTIVIQEDIFNWLHKNKGEYDWMYLDTYEEPTETAWEDHVLPFKELAQPLLKPNGTIEYWEKPRMDDGNFIFPR